MSKKIIFSSLLVSTLVLGTATSFADSVSTVDSSTPVPGVVTTKPSKDKDKDKDKDKGKTTTTSSNAISTKAVKTGDNTPIGIFVILLIAAIVVIGGGIYLKRRKK